MRFSVKTYITISVVLIAVLLVTFFPKPTHPIKDVESELLKIDRLINNLKEGESVILEVNDEYLFDSSENKIIYKTQIQNNQTIKIDEKLEVDYGFNANSFIDDINGDNQDDLVLENDKVVFAIKRIGDQNNLEKISTQGLITLVKIKETDRIIDIEDSKFIVDNDESTSQGFGYTRLIEMYNQSQTSITVHLENDDINYDITYSLKSHADFITIDLSVN